MSAFSWCILYKNLPQHACICNVSNKGCCDCTSEITAQNWDPTSCRLPELHFVMSVAASFEWFGNSIMMTCGSAQQGDESQCTSHGADHGLHHSFCASGMVDTC